MKAPLFSRSRPNRSGIWSPPRAGTFAPGAATTTPFVNAYSVEFDGVNEYMGCGDIAAMDGASTLTISAWIKRDAAGSVIGILKDFDANNRWGINAYHDGRLYWVSSTGSGSWASVVSNDTNWHHVALVFDGGGTGNAGRLKGYLDGAAQTLTFGGTVPALTADNSANFKIGRDTSNNTYSDGNIDEVAFWTTALSASDITAIYGGGTPTDLTSLGPASWWRMGDSGTGSSEVLDVAGDNNGALFNNPSYELEVPSA